ncbi:poly ADP-ribose polymerase 1 [Cinnamomum micranthum f. kanehirae]|uniref:Poly ADP-ribose polymerase 1 n=1 Tax=Cinnamomum micranthum f. kanehirae TaxID=337451 RepID=A0A3S3NGD9_9MAGN|nr:poly ADP-ribose polymerase 1 [Cinnamomum micranthum f. kanehirae]
MMNTLQAWKAEYAKTSRSACRCIQAEKLRLGKMVQASKFDGFMTVRIASFLEIIFSTPRLASSIAPKAARLAQAARPGHFQVVQGAAAAASPSWATLMPRLAGRPCCHYCFSTRERPSSVAAVSSWL